MKLWIVGRKIPESLRSLSDDQNVLFDEESSAKPTPKIFQEATLLLAPIRVGGGTSYKILEAMSTGTPVVTMKLSADALLAHSGKDIVTGNNADQLADQTISLLTDTSLYQQIRKGGRTLVEKNYTWKEIAKKLDEAYKKTSR